jgi:hypothetical protein
MEKNEVDKVFELCLLLVTVIAAALLQYASFVYSQNFVLKEVNYTFRVTTIPIFVLVTTWIVLMLFPSITVRHHILGNLRRIAKEFCWAFFGNFFVLEMLIFFYLGFSEEAISSQSVAQYATLFSVVFTFLATWQYRKADRDNTQRTSRFGFRLMSICEHSVIYGFSYFLLMFVIYVSAVIPLP